MKKIKIDRAREGLWSFLDRAEGKKEGETLKNIKKVFMENEIEMMNDDELLEFEMLQEY